MSLQINIIKYLCKEKNNLGQGVVVKDVLHDNIFEKKKKINKPDPSLRNKFR